MAQFNDSSSLHHHFITELLLVLLLLIPTGVWTAGNLTQYFVEKPPETVNTTSCTIVTLPCVIKNRSGDVTWTLDGFGLGDHYPGNGSFKNAAYYRYSMPGDLRKGNYSLVINTINAIEDGKAFECQVGPGRGGLESYILRARSKMNVVTPPLDVKIVDGKDAVSSLTENDTLDLNCSAFGPTQRHRVNLTWLDASSGKMMEGVDVEVGEIRENLTRNWDDTMESIKSHLHFKIHRDHHKKTIVCQGRNEIGTKTDRVQLDVQYAPVVNLTFEKPFICEFDNLEISCLANGNPSTMTYHLLDSGKQLFPSNVNTKYAVVRNLSRAKNQSVISCSVSNIIGRTTVNKTINVRRCRPEFLELPKSVEVNEFGESVTLTCIVDAWPEPEIRWFHNSTLLNMVNNQQNLTVNVTEQNTGRYTCEASLKGYPSISADAYIRVKGPPHIISQPVQLGNENKEGRLDCRVYSVPKPVMPISWSRDGVVIGSNDTSDYRILEEPLDDGVKSLLIIYSVKRNDFGLYKCSVNNSYGLDQLEIDFQLNYYAKNLLVILSCVFAVVIVLVFVMIICLIHKIRAVQRKKIAKKNTLFIDWRHLRVVDNDKEPEQSSTDCDDEDDLDSATWGTRV